MPEIFRRRPSRPAPSLLVEKRSSPRGRGYDASWDRLSKQFRRKYPFCRFCEQAGVRVVFCDVVDHILPAVDRPDLQHSWDNLQSLCTAHHGGMKAWLEAQARTAGDVNLLVRWCAEPNSRPIRRGEVVHAGTEAKG